MEILGGLQPNGRGRKLCYGCGGMGEVLLLFGVIPVRIHRVTRGAVHVLGCGGEGGFGAMTLNVYPFALDKTMIRL